MVESALTSDVRQGYALPLDPSTFNGLGPRFGLGPELLGQRPYQGPSPLFIFSASGGAQPRLTSGGGAVMPRSPLRAGVQAFLAGHERA